MGRREQNKQRTRRALIEASLDLFRTRGFDQTRVQDIVEVAGVSPATFFNYFPSKEAVLEAQAADAAELYALALAYEVDRDNHSAIQRLEKLTDALAEVLTQDPATSRLMVSRTALFFGSEGAKADKDRHAQALLAQLVKQGQAQGELRPDVDPTQFAEIYTAMVTLTATNWLLEWFGPSEETLGNRLRKALAVLINGAANTTVTPHRSRSS